MSFEIGDIVRWESQASGWWKVKEGLVVEVVPPGHNPEYRTALDGAGLPRPKVSYVIKVGNRFYWPRTRHLQMVKSLADQVREAFA